MFSCHKVGARGSPLSRAQVAEVLQEIRYFAPEITFDPLWIQTAGDKDLVTPLEGLGKTDFFTKEIDEGLLRGDFRLAIHSAKDLPETLPHGLAIAAITAGQDPRDTIVGTIFPGAKVGVSSERRSQKVRELGGIPVAIRGTIGERLALPLDAVIVPEAALQRLGLLVKRQIVDWEVAPWQGRLAVVVREDDNEMLHLFGALDTRKKTLYVGHDPSRHPKRQFLVHRPLIKTHFYPPRPWSDNVTALVVTSPRAAAWLRRSGRPLDHLKALCLGKATAKALAIPQMIIAQKAQAEGVVEMLPLFRKETILYVHSAQSRPLIHHYLRQERFTFCAFPVYDTLYEKLEESFSLEEFDEFFFTSPSTVEAFLKIFKKLPEGKILRAIGPITKECLRCHTSSPI